MRGGRVRPQRQRHDDLAKTVEVGDEKIDGDTATVEVSSSEQEGSGSINLVKEDGEWKIDFTN